MTPYEVHSTLNHHMSRNSPNGVDLIEECDDCGQRWLVDGPSVTYPITLCTLAELNRRRNIIARTIINNDIGRGFNN